MDKAQIIKKFVDSYLQLCKVDSIDELTNEQVLNFLSDGHLDMPSRLSAYSAKEAIKSGEVTEEQVADSIKKFMKTGERFVCAYIEDEAANGHLPEKTGWQLEP